MANLSRQPYLVTSYARSDKSSGQLQLGTDKRTCAMRGTYSAESFLVAFTDPRYRSVAVVAVAPVGSAAGACCIAPLVTEALQCCALLSSEPPTRVCSYTVRSAEHEHVV